MNLDDALRTVNLLLAIGVVVWLIFRWWRTRELYRRGSLRKDIWTSSLLWCLASVVGSFEQLFETGTYARVVFVLGALLTTISILVRPNHEWVRHTEG